MEKTKVSVTPPLIGATHLKVSLVFYTLERNKKTCGIIKDNVNRYPITPDKRMLILSLRNFDGFWPTGYHLAPT